VMQPHLPPQSQPPPARLAVQCSAVSRPSDPLVLYSSRRNLVVAGLEALPGWGPVSTDLRGARAAAASNPSSQHPSTPAPILGPRLAASRSISQRVAASPSPPSSPPLGFHAVAPAAPRSRSQWKSHRLRPPERCHRWPVCDGPRLPIGPTGGRISRSPRHLAGPKLWLPPPSADLVVHGAGSQPGTFVGPDVPRECPVPDHRCPPARPPSGRRCAGARGHD